MHELRMWKWEYTDASGQRKVSRWLMTEHEAVRFKDPVRLQHTLSVIYDRGRKSDAAPVRPSSRETQIRPSS